MMFESAAGLRGESSQSGILTVGARPAPAKLIGG
jgi:hypothetical protein